MDTPDEAQALTTVFNDLSFGDKATLYSAVVATSIVRIAREDTQRNRAFYPVYFLPIGFIIAPIPIPGANLIPLAAMAVCMGGWTAMGLTASARRNRTELKRDFAKPAIIKAHQPMIVANSAGPPSHNVKNIAVAGHVAKAMWADTVTATRHFFGFGPR